MRPAGDDGALGVYPIVILLGLFVIVQLIVWGAWSLYQRWLRRRRGGR